MDDRRSDGRLLLQQDEFIMALEKGEDTPVPELKTAEETSVPVIIVGVPGGAFNIHGPGLGSKRGTLTIDGYAISVSSWNDRSIRGVLPRGVPAGRVELTLGDGTIRRGVFPHGVLVIR